MQALGSYKDNAVPIEAIYTLSFYIAVRTLPFLLFGLAIFSRFRMASILFITLFLITTAAHIAAQYKFYAIDEMLERHIPKEEIANSFAIYVPIVLSNLANLLTMIALTVLAIGIRRSYKPL
jgi:hypothetical protein